MGVEPYLIPPVLILGVAQRLVQTLCEGSGKKVPVDVSTKAMLEKEFADVPDEFKKDIPDLSEVYRLEPTPECPTGTHGRIACFEVFDMTPELERAILAGKPEDELFGIVRSQGMLTMKEDAIIKSAKGVVPFEEVNTLGGQFDLAEDAAAAAAPKPTNIAENGEVSSTPVVDKSADIEL
jgi:type II secretory ATPase GspE/PulE/Tfp pilus assembly ATPase PilB-like protein